MPSPHDSVPLQLSLFLKFRLRDRTRCVSALSKTVTASYSMAISVCEEKYFSITEIKFLMPFDLSMYLTKTRNQGLIKCTYLRHGINNVIIR